jgi:hypothetical protein
MNFNYVTEISETPSEFKLITEGRGWKASFCYHLGLKTVKVIAVYNIVKLRSNKILEVQRKPT